MQIPQMDKFSETFIFLNFWLNELTWQIISRAVTSVAVGLVLDVEVCQVGLIKYVRCVALEIQCSIQCIFPARDCCDSMDVLQTNPEITQEICQLSKALLVGGPVLVEGDFVTVVVCALLQ